MPSPSPLNSCFNLAIVAGMESFNIMSSILEDGNR
ncbi:unnamed protein product, partial [Rotaria sp. Silwood2]